MSNLPGVVTQLRLDRESNSWPCSLKPDALPLHHHATHMPIPSQPVLLYYRNYVTHTHTVVLLLFWYLSGTTRVSRYQKGKTWKGKTKLDLLEQEIVSGSGICWAICKSAPHLRQPRQHPTTQLCHLILISFSTIYSELYLVA